ncbi:hypothetical protein YPPY46_1884, partial [Yersinia pestis PY-46]
MHRYN